MSRPSFEEACSQYVHRYTMEHVPSWALGPISDGKFYAPQYRSDREWYDSTVFPGESHFPVAMGLKHCWSKSPTFPLGYWLDGPFTQTGKAPDLLVNIHDLGLGWFASVDGDGSLTISNPSKREMIHLNPARVDRLRNLIKETEAE